MIVGVDLSTYRIDLAWLENGKPQRWHQILGTPKDDTIDRLRRIEIHWPRRPRSWPTPGITHPQGEDCTEVCIEWPWGRGKALPPLMATVGIITRQAPPWARVSWIKAGDLRAAIGARNTKASARYAIGELYPDAMWEFDEHECDALVTCLGWSAILAAQEDAA
jgi:hypothetical protein